MFATSIRFSGMLKPVSEWWVPKHACTISCGARLVRDGRHCAERIWWVSLRSPRRTELNHGVAGNLALIGSGQVSDVEVSRCRPAQEHERDPASIR